MPGPGRPCLDPSGPKIRLSISLPPRHLEALSREALRRSMNRSTLVERLLERAGLVPDDYDHR